MRLTCSTLAIATILAFTAAACAESIQGSYVEARSVPCAECATEKCATDKSAQCQPTRAVLAWQVRQGTYDGQKLDGQAIIAVVAAGPSTQGAKRQTKTIFFVDTGVTPSQEQALVHLAKDLAQSVICDDGEVRRSKLDVRIAEGCGCGAAVVECQLAKFRTRRLTEAESELAGDNKTGNPLGQVFSSVQAAATEYQCNLEPAASAANNVVAFTGSFSR